MQTVVMQAPGDVRLVPKPMPVRKRGEVLLKLLYGGICGSDLGSYRGTFAYVSYPRVPGHEFSAEIMEADENAMGLYKGMVVTCNPYFNCGHCYACTRGMVNACMSNQTMGVQREGAFSQYLTMPIERVYDGKGIDPKLLAMIEPFCIGYHGISQGNVSEGDHVLIIGSGTIGMMAAFSAMAKGAIVTVCDVAQEKLEFAQTLGVEHIILNDDHTHFLEQVAQSTNGNGFDVTVEAVGLPSTFLDAMDAACYGGRMVQIGVGKRNADFNFTMLQKKELHVVGSRNALRSDFLALIDIVRKGTVPLERMISKVYPYQEAPKAFETFDKESGRVMKVLLDFTA